MEPDNQSVTPCNCRAPYARPSFNASRTRVAAVSNSQSLDLEIVTEQGDKVTFSMDAKASAVYASHGQVEGGEDDTSAQWSEFSAGQYEREVNFSVEGDLNADERREIRKVVKTINRMMRNFVAGKIKPMTAKAGKLEGMKTIDSMEVNMEYERHVAVARQTRAVVDYDRYGAAREQPAAAAPTPAIVPVRAPVTPAPRFSLETESRALSRQMAREVTSARAPLPNMLESVNRLLQAYQDMAGQWNPLGGQIMEHVRDLFDAALGQAAVSETVAATGTGESDD